MDVQTSAERFDSAISALPENIHNSLVKIPASVKAVTSEVRLRVDRPISLSCPNRVWFVDSKSQLHNIPRHCFITTPSDISQSVISLCNYSVHSHQKEFLGGYISLRGGHRAGICGTAVTDDGKITAVRDVTSINLRIAREINGAADDIIKKVFDKSICGVLVVGSPSSGKTTILRDLARQLAGGDGGSYKRVVVVDERGELGAVFEGIAQNNLGYTCDILNGYPKGVGIMTAVRTLSPEVIICDEIGAGEEVDEILDGLSCGVKFIASAHAGSLEELFARQQIVRLLKSGAFEKIVMLSTADRPGCIEEIVEVGETKNEVDRNVAHNSILYHDGLFHGIRIVKKGLDD